MNLKQLYDAKRKYYEAERIYGEYIYNYIREYYNLTHTDKLEKSVGARVEFKEIGKYSNPELVISSISKVLTDDIINVLCQEFQLKVTHKCLLTDMNDSDKKIISKIRVYFRHDYDDETPVNLTDVVNGIVIDYGGVNLEDG